MDKSSLGCKAQSLCSQNSVIWGELLKLTLTFLMWKEDSYNCCEGQRGQISTHRLSSPLSVLWQPLTTTFWFSGFQLSFCAPISCSLPYFFIFPSLSILPPHELLHTTLSVVTRVAPRASNYCTSGCLWMCNLPASAFWVSRVVNSKPGSTIFPAPYLFLAFLAISPSVKVF